MHRALGIVVLLLAVAALVSREPGTGRAQPLPPGAEPLHPVIVVFDSPPGDSPTSRSARAAERSAVSSAVSRDRLSPSAGYRDFTVLINAIALSATSDEIARLAALPGVSGVYPDRTISVGLAQSVPLIGANQAWANTGQDGTGMRIAVIDSGVDYTHPDLGGCFGGACKVAGGWDFVDNDPNPMDDHGHGTHVAAIAAGNGTLKGVAPGARIWAYRVVGAGGLGTTSAAIEALERALDPDFNPATNDAPHVINMSISATGDPDDPFSQAVDATVAKGVVVVVAAGNQGPSAGTIGNPGGARSAITVGATTKGDQVTDFSARGPVTWANGATLKPDVVAPGAAICAAKGSILVVVGALCSGGSAHHELFGTSMAAPHVAGAAALIRQAHPSWTPDQVKAALRMTALDLGQDYIAQGYGRIRVDQAIALPSAPLTARIDTSGEFAGTVNIEGSAHGDGFVSWVLHIGTGTRPASWAPLTTSNQPIQDGILFAGFNPNTRPDGIYTLRLRVTHTSGQVTEDRAFVIVDNVVLDAPRNYDVVPRNAQVEVSGTVLGGAAFQSFSVEWGAGANPSSWSSAGVSPVNNGLASVQNGLLATWNTGALPAGTEFTLRIVVTYSWGQSITTARSLRVDPLLKPGWPRRQAWDVNTGLPFAATDVPAGPASISPATTSTEQLLDYHWGGYLEPLVVDLDGNGSQEVMVFRGGEPAMLTVYEASGATRWAKPIGTAEIPGSRAVPPIAADLDGDGLPEIIVHGSMVNVTGAPSFLYAFNGDGTNVPGFPSIIPGDLAATILAADLDRDGTPEIVVQGNRAFSRRLVIVNANGTIRIQWTLPQKTWTRISGREPSPAVGNFDDDPDLEIVVAGPFEGPGVSDETGAVVVYNLDGSILPGWPRYTHAFIWGSPAVGDIDGDFRDDIVVGVENRGFGQGGVHVWNRHGDYLPGWPAQLNKSFLSAPALGDVNGDGRPEIAISRFGEETYLLDGFGNVMPGWPIAHACCAQYGAILADVNNDGLPEILTTAGNHRDGGGIFAWTPAGSLLPGYPLPIEVDAEGPVTVADIDGNGLLDLVASSDFDYDFDSKLYKLRSSVYVFEVPSQGLSMPWPQFQRDPSRTGRMSITPRPDADCNSLIEANDVLVVLSALAGLTGPPPCGGDANGDDALTLADALLLRRMVAALN